MRKFVTRHRSGAYGASALALLVASLAASPARAEGAEPAPVPANATDPNADVQAASDITVTARKRSERLQDVPISISAIGADGLNAQKIDKLQDLTQNIPNFSPITQNPRTSSLSIRGIGGVVGGADGSESGAGLIIDNVFLTYVGFAFQPLYDLAAVEVARGPQGTLLGKNTTVGATIIRTQAPTFTPEVGAEISPYNAGGLLLKAYANLPINDKLAVRVSYFREKNNGFYATNPYPLNDNFRSTINGSNTNRWAIRGQILWKPTENISDRLIVNNSQSQENNNYNSQTADNFTKYANGSALASPTLGQWLRSYYGFNAADLPNSKTSSTATNNSQFSTHYFGVSNELNVDFGWANLTSVTAFARYKMWPRNSQGYLGYAWESLGYDNNNTIESEELRLAGKFGKTLDWTVGAYGLIDHRWSNNRQIYGADAAELFGFANGLLGGSTTHAATLAADPTIGNALNHVEDDQLGTALTHSLAAFTQATWHISDRLDLTGGVRFTHEYRKGNVVGSQIGGYDDTGSLPANLVAYSSLTASEQAIRNAIYKARGGAFNAAYLTDVLFAGSGAGSSRNINNAVSWLVNPSFKVSRDFLIYASASHGEKSGVINTGAAPIFGTATSAGARLYNGNYVIGVTPLITKPEKATDFELGFKSAWFNRKVVLNAGIYQNTITNYQAQIYDTVNFAAPTSYVGNVPKVRLRGIEVEASYQFNPWLQLHVAGARTSAKYVSFPNAGLPADQTYGTSNPLYTNGLPYSSLSGTNLPNIAPWTINGGLNWDKPVGQILHQDVTLFGFINEAVIAKTRFSDLRSSIWLGQPTYALTNAQIGLRRPDGRISLSFWTKNLFNKLYAINNGIALNGLISNAKVGTYPVFAAYTPGEPRTFGATLGFKY